MDKPTEEAFCAQYEKHYAVQKTARALYREIHPTGMHTNGPCRVVLETSHVQYLLERWRVNYEILREDGRWHPCRGIAVSEGILEYETEGAHGYAGPQAWRAVPSADEP